MVGNRKSKRIGSVDHAGSSVGGDARRGDAPRIPPAGDQTLLRLYRIDHERRLRFARDLHDHIGQLTAALLLGLKRLSAFVTGQQGVAELERLNRQVDVLSDKMRSMSAQMRPRSPGDFGLSTAIAMHLDAWRADTAIGTEFRTSGIGTLPEGVEAAVFRVVQEALTNVARHATGASQVTVSLTGSAGLVTLTVEDDGAGLVAMRPATGASGISMQFGLQGMRARFQELGGTLDWESAPGRGFTVFGRIPLQEDRA